MTGKQWGEGVPPRQQPRPEIPEPDANPSPWTRHLEGLVAEGAGQQTAPGPHRIDYRERLPDGGGVDARFVQWPRGTFRQDGTVVRYESGDYRPAEAGESGEVSQPEPDVEPVFGGNFFTKVMVPEGSRRRRWGTVVLVGGIAVGLLYAGFKVFIDDDTPDHAAAKPKAAVSESPAAQPSEMPTSTTAPTQAVAEVKSAMDLKFKLPGCEIKSSVVHVEGVLPSFLLEHLQKNDKQFRYNIPAQTKGDVAVMLCDSDASAVTMNAVSSTPTSALFNYDPSKMHFVVDMTGMSTGVAKQSPHDAYEDILQNVSNKTVKVDGRHANQDGRTASPFIVQDMEVQTRRRLSTDAVRGVILTQAAAAMEKYCDDLAVAQGLTAEAITCTPTGEFTADATNFAAGHPMAKIHQLATPADPETRPIFLRAPFKRSNWTYLTTSVATGEAQ